MVKDKDGKPQEDLQVVHCSVYVEMCTVGRSPWGKQVRGT